MDVNYLTAVNAWADGHRYFSGTIRLGGPMDTTVGRQLDRIEKLGWRLHTWQVSVTTAGEPIAFPLFVRPE